MVTPALPSRSKLVPNATVRLSIVAMPVMFTAAVPPWAGMNVKDADPLIIDRLKAEHKLVHRGKIKHSYPFCWRTETPLIYKAITYYLDNQLAVEAMIAGVDAELARQEAKYSAGPGYAELRLRLEAKRRAEAS